MLKRFLLLTFPLLLSAFVVRASPVRISAWYWLNSAPKESWEGDFITMKNLGFTDVLVCWGLDLAGIVTRKTETRQSVQSDVLAMRQCQVSDKRVRMFRR